VGMATAMRRPMGGYSRGMRQRTKLAQALAHDPELLVLDEPLSGLDPVARMSMTELLRRWVAGGKGLLFASHMLHEVEAITESFLLICGGRLLASGTAEEVDRLLAEVPREIRIRCDDAAQLAHRLVQEKAVDSIRFAVNGEVLIVSTRSPTNLYTQLPAWTEGTGIRIRELQSADESLQRLFDSLLQIHRGAL
jgi:ABC-2 type transport system ATP-binding protein